MPKKKIKKNDQIKIDMKIKNAFNPNYFSYDIEDLNSFKRGFEKEVANLHNLAGLITGYMDSIYKDRLRKNISLKKRESSLMNFLSQFSSSITKMKKLKDFMCDIWDIDYKEYM